MNNNQPIRKSLQIGVVFGIIIVFMVLIGFHIIAATLISKAFGIAVARGKIPEVRFMLYLHILFGLWMGWSASGKNINRSRSLLQGLVSGLSTGVVVALFDLLMTFLIQSGTDVRSYLPEFSFDRMEYFLLGLGQNGIFAHLAIYTFTGIAGSLFAAFIRSSAVKQFSETLKSSYEEKSELIKSKLPPFAIKIATYGFYALLLAILLILPTRWGSYWNFVIGLVGIYVIAGIGLNIIVGLSGQLMLGYAAFFAMGAYSVALVNSPHPHNLLWGFWPGIAVGIITSILAAVILGLPIMRLRGDYLAIVTLGFGEIIRILLKSDVLTSLTGGPRGIHDIRNPAFFGSPFSSDVNYVYLIFAGIAITVFLFNRLQNSRTGRAWLAIKEDTLAAQATGVNLQRYKLLALCIGAAFAGLAGGIFAARNNFTGPNDHSLMVSINTLSIIIVGGVNSIPGIILGAFALKGLPEILREIENYRLLIFGALLIVMMLVRPNGLWPSSRPLFEKSSQPPVDDSEKETRGGNHA